MERYIGNGVAAAGCEEAVCCDSVVTVDATAAVVVDGLRLRKCFREKGVSSRLTGSAVVAVVVVTGSGRSVCYLVDTIYFVLAI